MNKLPTSRSFQLNRPRVAQHYNCDCRGVTKVAVHVVQVVTKVTVQVVQVVTKVAVQVDSASSASGGALSAGL